MDMIFIIMKHFVEYITFHINMYKKILQDGKLVEYTQNKYKQDGMKIILINGDQFINM
ncbi:hypothetical protein LCGC14_2660590 [marine sediment metagenome]|uniref:Uncharacterized protein n=1 Tax=marine sediment metagenome TaxID=412755 RepID=A0A0F9CIZ4_9ZZZZ